MAAGSYAVLKYLPNRERDEPRNVGVILASDATGDLLVRMTRQPSDTRLTKEQVAALDAFVRGLERQLQTRLATQAPEMILKSVGQEFSNSLIATEPKPVVVDDPRKVVDELFNQLVRPPTESFIRELLGDVMAAIRTRERQRP